MKLWSSASNIDKRIEEFTVGDDKYYDTLLAPYDIKASKAHVHMLASIKLLEEEEAKQIVNVLDDMALECEQGTFIIEDGVEDMHSQIEKILIEKLGDIGKKVHMGRSRNDQVLVALALYYKDELHAIINKINALTQVFVTKAETHKEDLMPGYTHSQVGMVSSFGLWFGAFAESLVQDKFYFKYVLDLIDQNPLGTAAGYGNSFPLDRSFTTARLGFKDLVYNPLYAQMTRGKHELIISQGVTALAYTLNKFVSDVCLFSSANYKFITLPESMTTGSSIMPHKKNPDVFELVRAKCNQLTTAPVQISMMMHNLMSGYHRDMQILKESIFSTFSTVHDILDILVATVPDIMVEKNSIDDTKYDYLYTVEKVNQYVLEGIPFRDAYLKVSQEVKDGIFEKGELQPHTHEGSMSNLCLTQIQNKWS